MAVIPPSSPLSPSHTPITSPPEGDYRVNRLFRHMGREEIEALAPQIEHLHYGKGELIVQRLDDSGGIHLLLKGALLANQYARSGREVGYRRISAGGYFGEISAIDG